MGQLLSQKMINTLGFAAILNLEKVPVIEQKYTC